jgi:AcrR family transcriptional regulator
MTGKARHTSGPYSRLLDRGHRAGLPSVATVPQQQRAQDSLDKLIESTRELLARKDFDDISVADIARNAGVSVGTFYTRFPTREHILAHLARHLEGDLLIGAANVISAQSTKRKPLWQIAEHHYLRRATTYRTNRATLLPLALIARSGKRNDIREIVTSIENRFDRLLCERIMQSASRIGHDDVRAAVEFATAAASASIREHFLYYEPISSFTDRHMIIIHETARMFTRYLRVREK